MFNLGMEGVKDAFEVFREILLPAYRKQAERKATLENSVRQAQIQYLNAQTLAENAKAAREKAAAEIDRAQAELLIAQAKKTEADAKLSLAQAEKLFAEAERERENMRIERIKLATEIIEKYNPNLSDAEKMNFVLRLLPDINGILESDLKILKIE